MDDNQTSIATLSDAFMDERAAVEPIMATFWGIPGHDHRWNDFSPEGWRARRDHLAGVLRRLGRITANDRDERVAIDVHRERIQVDIDMIDSGEYPIALSNLSGHHTVLRDIFEFMPRDGEAAWQAIHDRLVGLPAALASLQATYADGAARGLVASRRQAIVCAEQCEAWSDPAGSFADVVRGSQIGDLDGPASQAAAAFGRFAAWLRHEYAPIADERDGIGRDRYALHARLHNGLDLDLDEAYAWGWHELREVEARIDAIAGSLHPGTTREECIRRVEHDERYSLHGGDAFMAWTQDVIDRTFDELDGQLFDIPPVLRTCRAMRIPGGIAGGAYYTPPTEDFSRPGMTWQPVEGRDRFALWDELSTLYHESVPGHHLQLGHMMYRAEALTRFQRLGVFVSAHGEGWAMYAERLMLEQGYLGDPVYELGWLANQALRAARVVVDIGLHCDLRIPLDQGFHPGERWSADLATVFIARHSAYDMAEAREQVDRYLGMPAQAISYKLGERVWVEARERARRRLGDAFDLKRFHMDALDMGAMGLQQLATELDLIGV